MFRFMFSLIIFYASLSVAVPQKFFDVDNRYPVQPDKIVTYSKAGRVGATPRLKATEWEACHQNTKRIFSAGDETESIAGFIETPQVINNLEDMNKRALLRGQVLVSPWSGDYWPYASGLIASRYRDSQFALEWNWRAKLKYVQTHPVSQVLAEQGQAGVDLLSPAEKYDLLTASRNSSFASSMWQQGEKYADEEGEVERWMGICHGWAPAAIMESRPSQKVTLKTEDEQWNLTFLPSEIKGLVSYSWANNNYPSVFLGSRCQQKKPKRDANGRLIDPRCQDLNPGTWHQVVVNMVGRQKRSFVMDATFDYEVWNQPVKSYSYTYHNLNTKETSAHFQDVILKIEDVKDDKFASYRSPNVKYLIGVEMKLAYVSEVSANENDVDVEENDSVMWVNYEYDLELDAKYNIIGGEWYTEGHPDFVWAPLKTAMPKSPYDYALGISEWGAQEEKLPMGWGVLARTASDRGQILHRIVEAIIERSK